MHKTMEFLPFQRLLKKHFIVCCVFLSYFFGYVKLQEEQKLLVLTVATEDTDGFKRFMRSAKTYGINVEVLGMDEEWKGGNIRLYSGGGHKVNLLKAAMDKYYDDKNLIIMFVDSYDVIFMAGPDEIIKKFNKSKAKVLFSAEGFCWPDASLAEKYPKVEKGKRFLNSGGFLGYASYVNEIITSSSLKDEEDDQLFYTKIYLADDLRKKWSIKLDHKAEIFQNLNGAVGDVELRFSDTDSYLHNTAYATNPLVVHGNGASKVALNSLGNYLAKSWVPKKGCISCFEDTIKLETFKVKAKPHVIVGIFVEHPTPFFKEFLERILLLDYPKERMDLFIHCGTEYHKKDLDSFLVNHQHKYNKVTYLKLENDYKEWHARNLGLEECTKTNCDYFFAIDSNAQLTNPDALRLLIEQNRRIIAPLLVRPNRLWSNFWGSLSTDGFYARSVDYVDIVKKKRKGVWNVPYINHAYLIHGSLLRDTENYPSYIHGLFDPDMAFCKNLRDKGIFMYISNLHDFGHLINSETFDTSHLHNDLYEIYTNQVDWEHRYIHENYSKVLDQTHEVAMPCPDVYWFPVVTPIFCKHLIDTMEEFGQWSDGSNKDPRLAGGYENVPTRDIHMNQVGFEQHWLYFLREYIRPMQEKIFIGYTHDPPKALMNFVVRYRPDEQPSLRPHHDSSTYTINIALNRPKIDYEGGGCRFIRYNCSVTDLRLGWTLMHPGRLTHYHEGLKVTNGTRYIMISFVDP
ncbi:procollagen-lysine,2-oxoglutarate 5-dioxygenase 1 isoform X2 [Parasteatoda tepidariorum]|uniref:procollagen-lysine,2-oxoglutarate 5-dioxygenase 1 isoform X2 n=1 Tax=Parasteatoda tepidariorum TaxID=114398 RepID=UPI001C7243FB|nr:procollagen-lysine,2-oxoglutarate 5-dioxygenase 1 isoform X2 [Parasteatoda tepidariorum]